MPEPNQRKNCSVKLNGNRRWRIFTKKVNISPTLWLGENNFKMKAKPEYWRAIIVTMIPNNLNFQQKISN